MKESSVSEKTQTIDALTRIVAAAKAKGLRVVHVRGVFDLINSGHIHRLEMARHQGDVLAVTIRPDERAGDDRPILDAPVRAQVLSRLPCIDYVAIETGLGGDQALSIVGADLCVDGVDNESGGAPGRLPVGGEGLPYSAEGRAFLREFRKQYSADQVIDKMKSLSNMRVLVVGDVIVDEYHFVRPFGMPLKAPIIAAQFIEGEAHAGGVLAVANHLAGFTKEVHVVSVLGGQDSREDFVRRNLRSNVKPQLFVRPDAPTTVKRRYVRKFLVQKLFEVSFFNDHPLPHELDVEISRYLSKVVADYDLVVVADFGQGFVSRNMIEVINRSAKFLAVNAQMNSINLGYHVITHYPRADYACIDEEELRMACRERYAPVHELTAQIAVEMQSKLMTVTRGHHGSLTYHPTKGFTAVPVLSREVLDTIGAGDAYLAVTAPCAAADFSPELIAFIGNAVGALAVKILGNQQPVTPEMLFGSIRDLLQ